MAQIEVTVPSVPILDALVPLMWGGEEVGSVLSPWEPLSPPARVRSRHELAAGVLTDLSRLEQVRRRTAMEVCDWFTRSWRTLTQDELRSMVVLMPEYTGRATARKREATPAAHQGGNLMEEAEPPKENVDPTRFSWLECEPSPSATVTGGERSRSESRRCHLCGLRSSLPVLLDPIGSRQQSRQDRSVA